MILSDTAYTIVEPIGLLKHAHSGCTVYRFKGMDHGCASEDTRETGVLHVSVTFNANGSGPFFTIEERYLEKVLSETVSGGSVLPPAFKENVDHPKHYGGADNPYEAIKVIEAWQLGFNLGNTVKYISRAGRKDDLLEDLKKARWYLDREIRNLEKKP